MSEVERNGDHFIVDAHALSKAFDLSLEETRAQMRSGQITSLCEAGKDEDAGRWRLTFRYQGRALRLIVDADGETMSKSTFPVAQSNATPPARSRE